MYQAQTQKLCLFSFRGAFLSVSFITKGNLRYYQMFLLLFAPLPVFLCAAPFTFTQPLSSPPISLDLNLPSHFFLCSRSQFFPSSFCPACKKNHTISVCYDMNFWVDVFLTLSVPRYETGGDALKRELYRFYSKVKWWLH